MHSLLTKTLGTIRSKLLTFGPRLWSVKEPKLLGNGELCLIVMPNHIHSSSHTPYNQTTPIFWTHRHQDQTTLYEHGTHPLKPHPLDVNWTEIKMHAHSTLRHEGRWLLLVHPSNSIGCMHQSFTCSVHWQQNNLSDSEDCIWNTSHNIPSMYRTYLQTSLLANPETSLSTSDTTTDTTTAWHHYWHHYCMTPLLLKTYQQTQGLQLPTLWQHQQPWRHANEDSYIRDRGAPQQPAPSP